MGYSSDSSSKVRENILWLYRLLVIAGLVHLDYAALSTLNSRNLRTQFYFYGLAFRPH